MTQLRVGHPNSTHDLSSAERQFIDVLQQVGFGHLESLRIRGGALVLDPWPTLVKVLRFGTAKKQPGCDSEHFELKKSVAEFFDYVRGVDDGEILRLEIRHGLPFSIQIEYCISRGMPDVKGEHVVVV